MTLSDDRVAGDAFTDSYTSATFDTKNVGTGKTVTRQRDRAHAAPTPATTRFNTTATTDGRHHGARR